MSLKIVITGASGHIGARVCQRIGNENHVVALVGSPQGGEKARPAGAAETHIVDLDQPEGLADLFADADAVCVITAGDAGPDRERHALEAAAQAGVGYAVKLSSESVTLAEERPNEPDPVAARHGANEADVQRLFDSYAIVRPTWWADLDQLPFVRAALAHGVFAWPRRSTSLAPIAPDDVARTIAALLLDPVRGTRILPLTGPETLTIDEIAVRYAAGLGRPIDVLDLTPDSYVDWLTKNTPMSKTAAAGVAATLMPFADRRDAPVSDAVETTTGDAPQRFNDYLAANFSADNLMDK
ncbi:NAD(P)H-binding protein [Gordonia terrae]|uniref:NAD(P)H-binding protein n=1 Tax=Gordonia terrae TaxID=2055 RepID=UPI003F6C4C60